MSTMETNISVVRASMRTMQRSITRRITTAAQRRQTSSAMLPIVTISRIRQPDYRLPRATRWRSTKAEQSSDGTQKPGLNEQLSHTLQESDTSDLVTEVRIPSDPNGVLSPDHPALSILSNSSLVIQRQIEMMNVLVGFEQANRYIIMNGEGETVGYIAERDHGIGSSIARQMVRTHRSFTTFIFDKDQKEVLRIHRPFAYLNTKIRIYDPIFTGTQVENSSLDLQTTSPRSGAQDFVQNGQVSPLNISQMRIIGECQSQWTATRRKYNLFSYRAANHNAVSEAAAPEQSIEAHMQQFSMIDEPMLAWDFTVKEEDGKVIGNVNRTFRGFAREIFTDTGVYVLRLDAAAQISALENADGKELQRYEIPALTLDQRAVMIATAVSIDFDYFSRHSGHGPGFMPMFIPMGGGAAEGGAVAGGAAAGEAAAGAGALEGAAGAAGRGAAGVGAMEGGIAGAGTMAGYEAMQRGAYGNQSADDASPQAAEPYPTGSDGVEQSENRPGDEVWGADADPFAEQAANAGAEDGGSWLSTIIDWFSDN